VLVYFYLQYIHFIPTHGPHVKGNYSKIATVFFRP